MVRLANNDPIAIRRANRRLALYLLGFILVSCILLILNVGIMYSIYSVVADFFIEEAYSRQIGQLVLLLGPFVLLFIEWFLYDFLIQPFKRYR